MVIMTYKTRMATQHKIDNFYDILVNKTKGSNYAYSDVIKHCPTLFKLLCDLYADTQINGIERWLVASAIAYFVAPRDVVLEETYGPAGYVDDLFMSVYVIKKVNKTASITVSKHWHEKEDLSELLTELLKNTRRILGSKTEKVLIFAGLMEKGEEGEDFAGE